MEITQYGFEFVRLNETLSQLEEAFRQIYGQDINIAPDTPDGQVIGLLAQLRIDIAEFASAAIHAIDPDTARGHWQEINAAYAGIKRKSAAHSYLREVILTGDAGAFIPNGATVLDNHKNRWVLVGDVTLNAQGSARADFRSEYLGVYELGADQPLSIETIVLGWHKAITDLAAQIGAEEETDASLRARAYRSRARPAQNSIEAVEANVRDLPDVSEVVCLENITNIMDINDLPPHSVNVIVTGGDDQAIAKAIYEHKSAGCDMKGEVEYLYKPETGLPVTIRFDRPQIVDCKIKLEIKRLENFKEVDIEAVKTALSKELFNIGEDVIWSRLFSPINMVQGFRVNKLEIGINTLASEDIPIGVRQKARFQKQNIEVVLL